MRLTLSLRPCFSGLHCSKCLRMLVQRDSLWCCTRPETRKAFLILISIPNMIIGQGCTTKEQAWHLPSWFLSNRKSVYSLKCITFALCSLISPLMFVIFDWVNDLGRFLKLSPNVTPPYLATGSDCLHFRWTGEMYDIKRHWQSDGQAISKCACLCKERGRKEPGGLKQGEKWSRKCAVAKPVGRRNSLNYTPSPLRFQILFFSNRNTPTWSPNHSAD